MSNPFQIGYLIEGVIEQDPATGRHHIKTEKGVFDVHQALAALTGKDVRFTLVSLEDLQKLAAMVETAGGGQVMGVGSLGNGSGSVRKV